MCGIAGLFGCQNIPKYDRIAEVLSQKSLIVGQMHTVHYFSKAQIAQNCCPIGPIMIMV